jgi:hypothetical protein
MDKHELFSLVLDAVERVDAEARKVKKHFPLLVGYGISVIERIADTLIQLEKSLAGTSKTPARKRRTGTRKKTVKPRKR